MDRFFNAVRAAINEFLEVVMVEVECLSIPSVFLLPLATVVGLQVENLLDVEQNLDDPVLTDSPLVKICLESQLLGGLVDEGMEDLALENDSRHLLGVGFGEVHAELQDGIRVNALLAEVNTVPFRHVRAFFGKAVDTDR